MNLRRTPKPPKHKHDWNLIDKTVLPGKKFSNFNATGYAVEELGKMMRDKVVLTFKCDCGDVKIETRS